MSTASLQRLLIYRFGQIGDTIAALPALWLLRQQFPQAHFTLLSEMPRDGSSLPPELVLPEGVIQDYHKYRGGSSFAGLVSMLRTVFSLRQSHFDAVAYLLPTIRTPRQRRRDAWFFRLAGIRRTFGFEGFPDDALPRDQAGRLLPVIHEADALLRRLACGGLPAVPAGQGRMDLGITLQEQMHADAWWLAQNGPQIAPRGWFAVCAGSKWTSKQWPVRNYQEVIRRLVAETGLVPVIFGGAEDRGLGRSLISGLGAGLCAAGEFSVRESAALLRHACFYLGNDTGVMHLAAAMGRPCVGIFSALDWPGRWFPYGLGHQVLRHEVPCAGCLSQHCPHHNECLTGISVDAVMRACKAILARQHSASLNSPNL